jgi:hypothetical protein
MFEVFPFGVATLGVNMSNPCLEFANRPNPYLRYVCGNFYSMSYSSKLLIAGRRPGRHVTCRLVFCIMQAEILPVGVFVIDSSD